MADSSVPVTGGSGYNIDTRTESTNSNHRQVVVIGDPSVNGGVAPVNASTGLSVNVTNTSIPITDNGGSITIDDGGSSITVDGTIAATQSGVWSVTNISGTVSLPTGASTLAEQQTQTTHLSAIKTAVELLDDAIYTDGTGTPSKALAVAGTDGTNPQIISTNASGHINIADGGNTLTVDGVVAATQSGTWNITNITGTVSLPTGAATSAKQDIIITSVQLIDDAIYTDGSGTPSKGIAIMGTDGTNPQLISVNSEGEVAIHDGGNSLTVDGSVTVSGTVTVEASTGFPSVVTDGSSAGTNAIHVAGTDGTNAQIISTNSLGHINIADGGNSITVDGTVTVTGTVTANAGTGFPPVVADGSAAGTGGIHVLGTDGTNAQLLSTSNTGVLHVQAQTGDNIIGRVKISDGTDVADVLDLTNSNPLTVAVVDGLGNQITSIGGGTEYNVDSVAGATDAGKLTLAVRDDVLGTLTPADGDYTQLRTNNRGALWVKPDGVVSIDDNAGSITVDGTVTSNAGTGFPQVVTDGTNAGTTGIHILGTDGVNAQILSTTSSGALNIADNGGSLTVDGTVAISGTVAVTDNGSTLSVDDNGGSLTVDGTVAATQSGTWNITHVSGTVSLPTGASTSAKQDTIITHLTDIKTAVEVLDNVVASDAGTNGVVLGAIYNATPSTINDGNFGALRITPKHALVTTIETPSGDSAMDDTNDALRVNVVHGTLNVSVQSGTNAIGRVGHDITGIGHGVTTVPTAGTDVALASSTACKRVIIQAQTDNTTGVAVGGPGVDATIATGTGVFLYPGDSIEIEIDNLADIYIDALTSGEGVRYTYFT